MNEHFITAYADAEATLRNPDLHQALYDADTVFLPRTVVCLHGKEHLEKKRVVMGVFSRKFFRHYQNHIFPATLRETLDPVLAEGRGDMATFAYRVLVNLVADSAGIDRAHTAEDTDRLLALIGKLGHAPTMGQLTNPDDREKLLEEVEAALAEFERDFFEPSAKRRRELLTQAAAGMIDESEVPHDVITAMLRHYDDEALPHDERVKDGAFFILAGAFTTANTLMQVVNEMLVWCDAHPQDRKRLVDDPVFLQNFIWEAVRLHPASPITKRRALCPMHLPNGEDAEQDDYVTVDLTRVNMDKEIFAGDAGDFNPHRRPAGRTPLHGLSFGGGAHACVGKMLAVGVQITDANKGNAETEYGTIFMVMRALLEHGIDRDPERAAEIDESTTRRHFHTLPFVFNPALARQAA